MKALYNLIQGQTLNLFQVILKFWKNRHVDLSPQRKTFCIQIRDREDKKIRVELPEILFMLISSKPRYRLEEKLTVIIQNEISPNLKLA